MNTSTLRKAFLVGTVFVMVGFVSASPVHAQENIFSKIKNGIQGSFEKIYLKLPGSKPGEIVLRRMVDAAPSLKSYQVNAQFKVSSPEAKEFGGSLELAGPVEVTDAFDPKTYQQQLNIKGSVAMEGTTLSADADLVIDKEKTYLRLNQAPAIPFVAVSEIKDMWLVLDNSMEAMPTKGDMREETKTETTNEPMDETAVMAAFQKLVMSSEVSSATRTKLDDHSVFAITVTVPDKAIEDFNMAMLAANHAEQEAEQQQQLAAFLAKTSDIKVNFWVDQNSFYPRQVELPLMIDVSDSDTSAVSALGVSSQQAAELKTVNLTSTIKMDKFNEPVTIQVPENATPFSEAMTKVMGGAGFMGSFSAEGLSGEATVEGSMMQNNSYKMMAPTGGQSVKIEGLEDLPADQKKMIEEYAKQSGVKLE